MLVFCNIVIIVYAVVVGIMAGIAGEVPLVLFYLWLGVAVISRLNIIFLQR